MTTWSMGWWQRGTAGPTVIVSEPLPRYVLEALRTLTEKERR